MGGGVEFRVLGSVEVYDEGVQLALGGPRPRTVLARLLLAGGTVVSTDTLIDDVYGGAPPASALPTLQSYVSNLRRIIEPGRSPRTSPRLLMARPSGYLLSTTNVDVVRFTELVTNGEFRPPAEALASLDEAMRLWRGHPYGEFADEPWAVTEVNRLYELRLVAIERRSQALLDLGRPQAVISELEAEAIAHPLRERLWCLLALALYRAGRQADALNTLRRARNLLADQLGLDPGPELRRLEEDILQHAEPLAPQTMPATAAAPRPARPRGLLGRERQLAELGALPSRTTRSGVTIAAVSGEPGIGKTRLLEAFRDHCADLGHLVLWGRCHDTEGAPALWPWLQVFDMLERHCPPPDRLALTGLLDDETPSGSSDGARLRRHQAIARWFGTAARAQPLAIILDDLHWADPASLKLLRDLIALISGLPENITLTLVTAFRDTAITGGVFHDDAFNLSVEDLLSKLSGYDLLRLRLTGLNTDAVRAIAADMGTEMDESAAHRLTERTGGNPFFVRETVRLLAEGRTLDDLPDAVADLIGQRIAALPPRAGEALGVAAVIGRDFDPAVVAEVSRMEVYDLLDQAARAGIVVARAGRMAFVHDLVRETLIQGIPPLRKAVIHRDVMIALSTRPNIDVAFIAHHAVEAGPAAYAEAVHWARAAAEQAGFRLAYEEAAVWWGKAISAHGDSVGDLTDHVELLLLQAHALLEAGDPISARQARAKAVRAADRAEAGLELKIRALTALNTPAIWPFRDPYEAVELQLVRRFEAALRELPDTDSPERARLLGGLAQELYDGNDDPRARSLSAEAVEMARRLGDPRLLMEMLNARHLSLPQPLCIPELFEVTDELYEVAERTQAPGFMLLSQMMYTHLRMETFDLAGATRAAARCDVLLEQLPLPWPRFQHTLWRACRLVLNHRFDDADMLYDEIKHQADRIGVWHANATVAMGRLALNYQRGTMAETGLLIDAIVGIHPSMDHDARVLQLCARGDVEGVRKLADEGWRPPPRDWSWLSTTCLQAAAQAAAGDVPACQVSYSALLPYSGRVSSLSAVICMGPVDWFLALLASAMGDHEAAFRHLTTLARQAGQTGLTAWRDRAMAAAATIRPVTCPQTPHGDHGDRSGPG